MAKRIIWTCDICGDTVPNDGPIHQIRFLKCNRVKSNQFHM